jgi:hypothetical protein
MKNIYKKTTFVWGCIGMIYLGISCTGNFDQINENPNTVPYYMMLRDNLMTGSAIAQMENYCVTTDANQYQRMFNLAGDVYSGYFGATNNWNSNNNNTTYGLYPEWYNVGFEVGYENIMAAWRVLDLTKEEDPVSFSLAQILKVFGMHKITDMYGPIPYSKFGQQEKVPYDDQERIYNLFFEELTAAIDVLYEFVQLYPSSRPLKNYDLIYGSDYSKWIKFANSLKLRLALRIYYADPAKSKQYAEEAVNHPIGVITANADNAFYPVPQINPLYIIWHDNNGGELRMGATMECYMNGYSDPRRPVYFTAQPYNNVDYHGVRNGININTTRRNNYNLRAALPNIASSSSMQWMVAAESYFLRAEGALRAGWNMGGTAEALYNEGIKVSFEQAGVSGYDSYIANNTAIPTNFTDPAAYATNNYTYNPANTLTVQWNDGATDEVKQERIITQKYLAMYPDGQEAWSEFRRTGYPKIIPNVLNNSGGKINTQTQIRRLVFPTTEYANNTEEVQKAVDLIGGEDHGGVRLWWDKK